MEQWVEIKKKNSRTFRCVCVIKIAFACKYIKRIEFVQGIQWKWKNSSWSMAFAFTCTSNAFTMTCQSSRGNIVYYFFFHSSLNTFLPTAINSSCDTCQKLIYHPSDCFIDLFDTHFTLCGAFFTLICLLLITFTCIRSGWLKKSFKRCKHTSASNKSLTSYGFLILIQTGASVRYE